MVIPLEVLLLFRVVLAILDFSFFPYEVKYCPFKICKELCLAGQLLHKPLIPELGRQRQADLCEFEVSLVYRVSSRTARAVIQRNPVLKQTKKKEKK